LKADLHVHSTASDGSLPPRDLVSLALEAGLTHMALADHDTTAGLHEAREAAEGSGLTVIPAVELSTLTTDGQDAHVLGYFIDPSQPELVDALSGFREARLSRAYAIVESLSRAGLPLTIDDVLSHSRDGAVGRSHVARALVDAGHVGTVADAFAVHIGRGRPHYITKAVPTPKEAIALIHSAGGLAVLAHPAVSGFWDSAADVTAAGFDGIEAYHADHTPEQRTFFRLMADSLGLFVTGGSDFHGPEAPNPAVGSIEYPPEALSAFLAAAQSR
jgi:predicted metal-dependent phosphoesterase TrpH